MLGLFFFSVARVPGWHHYRTFSFIALLTAGYAALDIASGSTSGFHWQTENNASMSLMLGLASETLWLRFDREQQQRKLSGLELVAMGVLLLGCLLCLIPNIMVGELHTIESSWIRMQYHVRATNSLADLFIVVLLACMLQLVARYTHRAWQGRGSWLAMGAALIFTLGEIQEGLVASKIIDWPFLGCVGLTLALLLIAMGLGAEVASNANQLADFHLRLKARVEVMAQRYRYS